MISGNHKILKNYLYKNQADIDKSKNYSKIILRNL